MMNQAERVRAERFSALLDELMADPATRVEGLEADETELLPVARRLARLPALLGPVDPVLEQRVMCQLRAAGEPGRRMASRWPWAVAAVAATLLLVLLLTPMGQTAVASFLAVFNLGRTEVQISQAGTPIPAGHTAIREQWTLEQARERLSFALPQPAYLPEGSQLQAVYSYTYPDLPEWVPQPIFVDLAYGDATTHTLTLRVYPIMLGDEASISGMNLEATSLEKVQDLDINGQPGVLLRVGGNWQEVVWEQGDLILALLAPDLPEEELLAIARSIH